MRASRESLLFLSAAGIILVGAAFAFVIPSQSSDARSGSLASSTTPPTQGATTSSGSGTIQPSVVSNAASSNSYGSSSSLTASQSSCESTSVSASGGVGGAPSPCGCPFAGRISNQQGNVTFEVYMTPEPKVGDEVCLFATVEAGAETPFIEFTITNSTGAVFNQVPCILASSQGEKDGSLISCQAYWDTGIRYHGNEPVPGSYRLYVTTQPYSSKSDVWLPFTLS